MIYANDNELSAAHWLSCLPLRIDRVDSRSIKDVLPNDLRGFTQCHFFAGIGGWPLALKLAGCPDDASVWTGSCPCQPFSAAGKGKGFADERHLWPEWFRLIKECRPQTIFGEQVASAEVVGTKQEADFFVAVQRGDYARANKLANRLVKTKSFGSERRWVDAVRTDLEGIGYSFWFQVLGAHSVGAPHIRQRLFWVAHRSCERWGAGRRCDGSNDRNITSASSEHERLAYSTSSPRAEQQREPGKGSRRKACPQNATEYPRPSGGLANTDGRQSSNRDLQRCGELGFQSEGCGPSWLAHPGHEHTWRPSMSIEAEGGRSLGEFAGCGAEWLGDSESDNQRRPPVPAMHGQGIAVGGPSSPWSDVEFIPCRDGKARPVKPGVRLLAHGIPGRVAQLRGLGNAIVPAIAAEFVRAFMESKEDLRS